MKLDFPWDLYYIMFVYEISVPLTSGLPTTLNGFHRIGQSRFQF